jgi:hypothetical protein
MNDQQLTAVLEEIDPAIDLSDDDLLAMFPEKSPHPRALTALTLPPARGFSRRSAHRRRSIVAALAVVVAAVTVVSVAVGIGGSPSNAAAAMVLKKAARELILGPRLPSLAAGQAYYELDTNFGACNWIVDAPGTHNGIELLYQGTYTTETWVAVDGSAEMRTTPLPGGHWATRYDETTWRSAGSPTPVGPCFAPAVSRYRAFTPTSSQPGMSDLPPDPQVLGALIAAGRVSIAGAIAPQGHPISVSAQFDVVNNLMGTASPGQRQELVAVLYDVMANLPGVQLLGHRVDDLGRQGIAIVTPAAGNVETLYVIDPQSGQLLDVEYVLTSVSAALAAMSGLSVGDMSGDVAYGSVQVVNGIGHLPG